MSLTRAWATAHTTVTRTKDDGSGGQGDGQSKRLYAGRFGGGGTPRNYKSYLLPALDWTGVGKIVKAVLTVYTDDRAGLYTAVPAAPKVLVERLTSRPNYYGNNGDGSFDASDYTTAVVTATGHIWANMQAAHDLVTSIDITSIVEAWAPATVKTRAGVAGGKAVNNGLVLAGTTTGANAWAGWSAAATDPAKRPFITLTYESGPTTPNTPANLSPAGEVASIDAFQGDFSDPKPTDILAQAHVQVYPTSAVKAGTGVATNNNVAVAAHGYKAGQEVWFHTLTGGVGLSTGTRYYVKSPTAGAFLVTAKLGGPTVDITTDYSALTVAAPLWSIQKVASNTEVVNARFNIVPAGLHIPTHKNFNWRARYVDQEGRWSAWSGLVTFDVTNTDPNAPATTPASGSFASLTGVNFRGGFSDPDAGDKLLAFECQLSAYGAGDPNWDDDNLVMWHTGKIYVAAAATTWQTAYTGQDLAAGVYYWRARVWDNHDGVSDWTYHAITLTADFDAEPGRQTVLQVDPHAPWRIIIKEMAFVNIKSVTGVAATNVITTSTAHGLAAGRKVRFSALTGGAGLFVGRDYYVIASGLGASVLKVSATLGGAEVDFTSTITAGTLSAITTRGPGLVLAVFEHASSPGASILYNSPGEMHFTLGATDPQIAVVEPRQTHYAFQFYGGDGWRETFAGLVTDFDANENDVVFTGIDYLGLMDYTMDERYFPSDPNRAFSKGGSYYVNQTIRTIVVDQLTKVSKVTDSPVGFIGIGNIDALDEKVSSYSTMVPVLSYVSGLLDSHRAGTGKTTRIQVKRTTGGAYQFVVTDNPGQVRDNLRLRFGELVQGYRVIAFGNNWGNVLNAIGQTREGLRVLYNTTVALGIDPHVWGRWAKAVIMQNIADELDLGRRALQVVTHNSKLGSQMGLGIKTQLLGPLNGYDVCDAFPVAVIHGAVDTTKFGSGYWVCYGVTWEGDDDGGQTVTLTLLPRDDTTAPSPDLIDARPISPQMEWQIGWTPPDPLKATSKFWVDLNTGIRYTRDDVTFTLHPITGTA